MPALTHRATLTHAIAPKIAAARRHRNPHKVNRIDCHDVANPSLVEILPR
jgi:hypothetical protein